MFLCHLLLAKSLYPVQKLMQLSKMHFDSKCTLSEGSLIGLSKTRSQTKLREYKAVIFIEGLQVHLGQKKPTQGLHPKWMVGHKLSDFYKFGPFAYWGSIFQLQLQIVKISIPSLLLPNSFCLHFSGSETVRCP